MTVEEWLGKDNQIGIDIWNGKYRDNDTDETYDQWVQRVSGDNAEVAQAIVNKEFLFGGRILANRGLSNNGRKITYSNCFRAGTKIITRRGLINIEDVIEGDYVLSHDGDYHIVNSTMTNQYTGDMYRISSKYLVDDIVCTPNHKILTPDGWKTAEEISIAEKNSDKFLIAANPKQKNISINYGIIDLLEGYIFPQNQRVHERFGKIQIEAFCKNKQNFMWQLRGREVNRYIQWSPEFSYFVGRWLGDGSITKRGGKQHHSILQIVFNASTEKDAFERCLKIGTDAFGCQPSIRFTEQNIIALRFESEIICDWFYRMFGSKCDGKRIPENLTGDWNIALGLCDADGCITSNRIFRIVLKNKQMITWLRNTMFLNGINCSSVHDVKRQPNTYQINCSKSITSNKLLNQLNKNYSDDRMCSPENKEASIIPIEGIQKEFVTQELVYNLSVEDSHTYTANGVVVHNCYVLGLEDSIESIFDTARDLARTFSYGGGVGIDIGNLAPRGAKVNNAAKTTSGAVSFMDLYSAVTGLIGQSGRRGALMISIPVNHPDIEEFITVKEDLERVTKANISVRITDEFMECVKSNAPFKLYHKREATGEETVRWVNARELFSKLAQCNWNTGEPGILFWDRIETHNFLNTYDNFKFAGVNPCFTGDMELLTQDGYKRFDELNGQCVELVNIDGDISHGKVWENGTKETVKIIFADGSNITCTPDHVFMTIDGDECRAKDLKGIRVMPYTAYKNTHNPLFLKLGYIQGDGQLADVIYPYKQKITVNIGNKDGDIQDLFSNEEFTKCGSRAIYVSGFNEDIIRLGFSCETLPTRVFPSTYETWDIEEKSAFICGCYSANGSIIKGSRISYKTTCKDFADSLVKTLQSDFGIGAYITTNKSKPVEFKNGTYVCKQSYDVNIGQQKDIRTFAQKINFYQTYKRTHLKKLIECRAPYVYDVIPNGDEVVYDFSEPIRHWGVVNGFAAHNCAEEPLPDGGSCLLGSLNLSAFVRNAFEQDAEFDMRRFRDVAHIAVIALNEVLDEGLLLHPLQVQRDCVRDWRQIGLGIMGLGDALIKLNLEYGSQKAIGFSQKISTTLLESATIASSELAKEFGSFPKFDVEKTINSKFGERLPDYIKQTIRINGLRNSQLLTVAPTGTLATMLGISSGIEPQFAISYTRKTESLHGKDTYYNIYAPIAQAYLDYKQTDKLPKYFVGASDIAINDRIAMQAAWQNNIDASISSTVNLPESTSAEDIESLYMSAWESGLKGITVFRDNCKRAGILTKEESKEDQKEIVIPRGFIIDVPDILTYRKYKIQSGCGKLYLFVGVDETEQKIYDVFTNTDGTGGCSINTQANSRLLSACVRGGVPIEYVIEQLQKAGTCPSYQYARGSGKNVSPGKSCPSAIAKILQQILDEFKDDEKEFEESFKCEDKIPIVEIQASECPECKNKTLYHEGGCIICKSCGYSKCS